MTLFGLALAVFFVGACGALLTANHPRSATRLGAGGAVLGSAFGLVPAVQVLLGRDLAPIELPWSVPGGEISLGIDALSAFFLVPIFALGAAAAIYGAAYLRPEAGHKPLGMAWLWFDLLLAAMALVATARNGLFFLVAWEAMALSSFFLVVFHHEQPGVPRAGWVYLVATHLGTAFLLVLFACLAQDAASLDFARWGRPETGATWLFAFALIGFGSKAGFFPFHVWLPQAHPVAPSHVSALLSGVMVKLGIYGLLRLLVILGPPDAAWGVVLLAVGLASALYGALAVLAQRDLKRCLAYSTVENLGIVSIGLGLGVCLLGSESPLAGLALAGGLLHVWNHALFKSLLFLASGSVARGAGTLDLELLGGLMRRMPWTSLGLLVGGAAACALPPLNGFVSEFLIYLSAFRTVAAGASSPLLSAGLATVAGLAFVGALAAAGFVRLLGIGLLGESRSDGAARARETEQPSMRAVLVVMGAACLILGIGGAGALAAVARPVAQLSTGDGPPMWLQDTAALLWQVGTLGGAVGAGALVLLVLRRRLLPKAAPSEVGTWDCGYAAPSARMQYTASSFAEPLTRLFRAILNLRQSDPKHSGVFPLPATFTAHSRDVAERLYAGIFAHVVSLGAFLRRFETGNAQLYVLYTVVAALALLGWGLLD